MLNLRHYDGVQDHAKVVSLLRETYAALDRRLGKGSLAKRGYLGADGISKYVKSLARKEHASCWVAENRRGKILAFAVSCREKWDPPGYYRFAELAVRPEKQNKGIGLRLDWARANAAKALGYSLLCSSTFTFNTSQAERWEALGWEKTRKRIKYLDYEHTVDGLLQNLERKMKRK